MRLTSNNATWHSLVWFLQSTNPFWGYTILPDIYSKEMEDDSTQLEHLAKLAQSLKALMQNLQHFWNNLPVSYTKLYLVHPSIPTRKSGTESRAQGSQSKMQSASPSSAENSRLELRRSYAIFQPLAIDLKKGPEMNPSAKVSDSVIPCYL